MDSFDHQILKMMQTSTRRTTEEIGQEIGLSATAVQRRLKALRESGVIEKEIAVLNPSELGGHILVIVEVMLVQGGNATVNNFKKKAKNYPEVQQCYYVTGENDFILVIAAKSMQRYDIITQELFLDDKSIFKFNSNVVMGNVKVGLEIPLP
ncbi:Lrp/AsnC family transcriptional regulator [Marinomonas transparens]|uniref:Lrp/AsnC family transcriptional regulator n=1 Tax=Marinomonas transparens TaxID=2795388 RepID=A0A934N2L4_9GAMM|nr:Lrp/AsnC family transcriptional regulator [Marinomonas transparens]MBJ7537938.1 Lrp/AsnC family transcriptional regulator [Marinomonas transparens]